MIRWIQRWYREDGRREAEDLARIMSELALNLVRCKSAADSSRAVRRTASPRRVPAVTKEKPARARRKTNA